MIVMETERMVLKQFTWDDLEEIAAIMSDPAVTRYIGDGTPYSREKTQDMLGKYISCTDYSWSEATLREVPQFLRAIERKLQFSMWAMIERETGELVGKCGLNPIRFGEVLEVEVGYILGQRFWGRGLATEAAKAARDYAMDRLGYDRLISLITHGNKGSIRVAEKNGMKLEKDIEMRGVKVHVYALTRGEVNTGS